jgi:hypothetical protein
MAIVQLVIPLHAATKQKDEQILDVLQEEEEEDDSEDTAGDNDDENQIESQLIEADKKAPIAISGDNSHVVWFSDQNTPNNNSEVRFRSSNDGGVTFAD